MTEKLEVTTVGLRARADETERYGTVGGNAEWLRGAADVIDDLCHQLDRTVGVASEALGLRRGDDEIVRGFVLRNKIADRMAKVSNPENTLDGMSPFDRQDLLALADAAIAALLDHVSGKAEGS